MSILGNGVWLIFGGLIAGFIYIFGGLVLRLTIVGIPFGLQSIKLGVATLTPFGKEVVETRNADSPLKLIFNLLWILLFGWEMAVAHLISAAIQAVTIIGLPFAK